MGIQNAAEISYRSKLQKSNFKIKSKNTYKASSLGTDPNYPISLPESSQRQTTSSIGIHNILLRLISHLVVTPGLMIDQMLGVAGLKLKLAEFNLKLIQLGTLFANIPFNSQWDMPHGRRLACGKSFRILV